MECATALGGMVTPCLCVTMRRNAAGAETRRAAGNLMASRGKRKKSRGPRFPRRTWEPGQKPRVEKPKKGGGYDRTRQKMRDEEETT